MYISDFSHVSPESLHSWDHKRVIMACLLRERLAKGAKILARQLFMRSAGPSPIQSAVNFNPLHERIQKTLTTNMSLSAMPMELTAIDRVSVVEEECQSNAPSTTVPDAIAHPSFECCEICSSPADCQSSDSFFYDCAEYPLMKSMMIEEARIGQDRSPQATERMSVKPRKHFDRSDLQDEKTEQAAVKKHKTTRSVAASTTGLKSYLCDCLCCQPPGQVL